MNDNALIDEEFLNLLTLSSTEFVKKLHSKYQEDLEKVNEIISTIILSDEKLISDISEHLLQNSGKRIRPLLTIISSKIFGYEEAEHINLASAVEFIHVATLLHDDVVDESLIRRFLPSANSVWGNKSSILVGDFLFSSAFRLMVLSNSIDCLSALANASSIIARGEVSQLSSLKQSKIISIEEYMDIISAKTAELFGAACQVGAIIAGAKLSKSSILKEFGMNLGVIYQIRDDWLDYFATISELGKNIGDDFAEGKSTLPIILLFKKLPEEEKSFLERLFAIKKERTEDNFKKIISLIEKYKIEDEINYITQQIYDDSMNLLNKLGINNNHVQALKALIHFASNRRS